MNKLIEKIQTLLPKINVACLDKGDHYRLVTAREKRTDSPAGNKLRDTDPSLEVGFELERKDGHSVKGYLNSNEDGAVDILSLDTLFPTPSYLPIDSRNLYNVLSSTALLASLILKPDRDSDRISVIGVSCRIPVSSLTATNLGFCLEELCEVQLNVAAALNGEDVHDFWAWD